jgi:hypothetical protein
MSRLRGLIPYAVCLVIGAAASLFLPSCRNPSGAVVSAVLGGNDQVFQGSPIVLSADGSISPEPIRWFVPPEIGAYKFDDSEHLKQAVMIAYAPPPGQYTITVLASGRSYPWQNRSHAIAMKTVTVGGGNPGPVPPGPGPGPGPGPVPPDPNPRPSSQVAVIQLFYDPAKSTTSEGPIRSVLVSDSSKAFFRKLGIDPDKGQFTQISVNDPDADVKFPKSRDAAKAAGIPALVYRDAQGYVIGAEKLAPTLNAVLDQISKRCGR